LTNEERNNCKNERGKNNAYYPEGYHVFFYPSDLNRYHSMYQLEVLFNIMDQMINKFITLI